MSVEAFMNAIGTIESGNDYGAIGINTGKMGRARGRYQIMSANWPAWSREAGLGNYGDWKNPAHQDQVARFKMNQYYQRYKNWDLVAVAWFGGPGAANKAEKQGLAALGGTKDGLGTSVPDYVRKYRSVWNPDGGNIENSSVAARERREVPRAKQGIISKPLSRLTDAVQGAVAAGTSTTRGPARIAPIEAAEGQVLDPAMEARRNSQISSDSFATVLTSISNAAKAGGGQIIDAKKLFGLPVRQPMPVQNAPAPEPAAAPPGEEAPAEAAAPAPGGGPMADPPKHAGFAGLTEGAKTGSLGLMGAFPGLRFTSGHRTVEQNRNANGVRTSKHVTGQASDFVGSEQEMQAAAKWAKDRGAKTLIHDAGSGRHLHIEWS